MEHFIYNIASYPPPPPHTHTHTHTQRADGVIEYQGFVRVHMCVQRPIHVSTAITRTSWYQLMRPVKERGNDMHDGFEVSVVCVVCVCVCGWVGGEVYVGGWV